MAATYVTINSTGYKINQVLSTATEGTFWGEHYWLFANAIFKNPKPVNGPQTPFDVSYEPTVKDRNFPAPIGFLIDYVGSEIERHNAPEGSVHTHHIDIWNAIKSVTGVSGELEEIIKGVEGQQEGIVQQIGGLNQRVTGIETNIGRIKIDYLQGHETLTLDNNPIWTQWGNILNSPNIVRSSETSFMMGHVNSAATGEYSSAFGLGTRATRRGSMAVGRFGETSDSNDIFVVGNGNSNLQYSNAFAVRSTENESFNPMLLPLSDPSQPRHAIHKSYFDTKLSLIDPEVVFANTYQELPREDILPGTRGIVKYSSTRNISGLFSVPASFMGADVTEIYIGTPSVQLPQLIPQFKSYALVSGEKEFITTQFNEQTQILSIVKNEIVTQIKFLQNSNSNMIDFMNVNTSVTGTLIADDISTKTISIPQSIISQYAPGEYFWDGEIWSFMSSNIYSPSQIVIDNWIGNGIIGIPVSFITQNNLVYITIQSNSPTISFVDDVFAFAQSDGAVWLYSSIVRPLNETLLINISVQG